MDTITIKGARVHNLKNIDVTIPKNKIVAITGVSGSGKSSLAFDILYQEGRLRYLQSIGFPPKVEEEKPFDSITGLSPCVAVEQRTARMANPRSTVGTRTTLYTMLRMLYSIESRPTCPVCLVPVKDDLSCDVCGMKASKMEIKHFSFNEPSGMCLECKGRGFVMSFTEDKIIPDTTWSLKQILKNASGSFGDLMNFTKGLAEQMDFDMDAPWDSLPDQIKDIFLHGTIESVKLKWKSKRFEGEIDTKFEGVIPHLERAVAKSTSQYRRDKIEQNFMNKVICPECHGFRINGQARGALINGKHIGELAMMPVSDLKEFLLALTDLKTTQGKALVNEIAKQLDHFELAGISYLHLNRNLPTLSGGEVQRVSLLSHLDASLDSIVYILDEPTMGMHEIEKNNLKRIMQQLKDQGSTVMIVEHDPGTVAVADYIVDIGPGAGTLGGEVMYQGAFADMEVMAPETSMTAQYLFGQRAIPKRRAADRKGVDASTPRLLLKDVAVNNLKDVSVEIPLGMMVGVCGVSGSGKSSLVSDCLVPLLRQHFHAKDEDDEDNEYLEQEDINGKIAGWDNITDCIVISQAPIGRTKTSMPASYTGIWDDIRKLFAKQPEAKKRNYTEGHFSFNSDKGRCEECKGEGTKDLQISFLSNIDIPCEECGGTGYKPEVLEIIFNDKNIHDILHLTVDDAIDVFAGQENITRVLEILQETGMGYITLGQPATTLSGGEAQRIKLAREIGRGRKTGTLYVLDEPTTGLHPHDVEKLLALLDKLVTQGNSIIIIEHDIDVLSHMDYLIELGPGGGPKGGEIIATGTPEEIMASKNSIIAPFLHL